MSVDGTGCMQESKCRDVDTSFLERTQVDCSHILQRSATMSVLSASFIVKGTP